LRAGSKRGEGDGGAGGDYCAGNASGHERFLRGSVG
jgi:hypothetical protein